jgi:hypothetical protein
VVSPIAAIIAAELPATGSAVTGSFQGFEAGKIEQWLSGGMAMGRGVGAGVGLGVGLGVGSGVGLAAGWVGGVALAPGTLVCPGELDAGEAPNEPPGAIVAYVPGAEPEAIARSDGGDEAGPTVEGAQAVISATTSAAPIAADRRLRCTV